MGACQSKRRLGSDCQREWDCREPFKTGQERIQQDRRSASGSPNAAVGQRKKSPRSFQEDHVYEWESKEERKSDSPNRAHPQDPFVPASIQRVTPGGGRGRRSNKVSKVTLSGDKYCYQAHKEKWLKIPMKIEVEREPFNEGGMRYVYRCWEIDALDGSRIASCAKVFKDGEGAQAYFDEAMTQMVSESYAQEFNRECSRMGLKYNVGFVPVSVLHLTTHDGNKVMYNVEPMLKGHYIKHNDNDGNIETEHLLPQAFSHYTYERSNNLLVVIDIQGVGSFYTDPQIHSFDGEGFGLGNLGKEGVTKFLKTHECNQICKLLELPSVTVRETDFEMAMRLQEEENNRAKNRGKGKAQKAKWTSVRYKKELKDLTNNLNKHKHKESFVDV